jgi:hypothetical protein
MQKVLLNYDNPNFFCPITGVQILSENDANLSPACVFLYCDIDFETFDSNNPDIQQAYDKILESMHDTDSNELYEKYDYIPFSYFINEVFEKKDHYILFELTSSGMSCGPSCNTTYIVIDTSYEEALDR